jgi:hypothetical protein
MHSTRMCTLRVPLNTHCSLFSCFDCPHATRKCENTLTPCWPSRQKFRPRQVAAKKKFGARQVAQSVKAVCLAAMYKINVCLISFQTLHRWVKNIRHAPSPTCSKGSSTVAAPACTDSVHARLCRVRVCGLCVWRVFCFPISFLLLTKAYR